MYLFVCLFVCLFVFFFKLQEHLCPENWKHFNDNCYIVKDNVNFLSWYDAEERCLNEDAHLVSIRDKEDMDFIHSLIIKSLKEHATPPLNVFIGKLHMYCFGGTIQVLSLITKKLEENFSMMSGISSKTNIFGMYAYIEIRLTPYSKCMRGQNHLVLWDYFMFCSCYRYYM